MLESIFPFVSRGKALKRILLNIHALPFGLSADAEIIESFIVYVYVFVSLRMLLEKSSGQRLVFSLTVSGQAIVLRYGQSNNQTSMISFRTEDRLGLETWTHLVLQVRNIQSLGIPMMSSLSCQPCYGQILSEGSGT